MAAVNAKKELNSLNIGDLKKILTSNTSNYDKKHQFRKIILQNQKLIKAVINSNKLSTNNLANIIGKDIMLNHIVNSTTMHNMAKTSKANKKTNKEKKENEKRYENARQKREHNQARYKEMSGENDYY